MELGDVTRNYNGIAGQYDFWTDLVFHRLLDLYQWRCRTIEQLGEVRGATVLDVGCGTGNNWPLLLPIVGANGQVIGVDYSAGMLEQARRRADKAGWSNISLIEDDAAKLAHLDGPVDAFVSAWCLGIVHDLPAALTRIVELVKPGGRIVILDFAQSRPDHRFFHNAGVILHGTRPARSDSSASKAPR
jgi:ubiquinone/menaquinone biosynthesis C-methylase UbiE